MTQWYVKELSKITQISVQTLHHYDRIGLLQPSVRLANGYRLYSEKDLLKLQQIIALKFFGFELSQIKELLTENIDVVDHFSVQSQLLEEKARTLLAASNALKSIITDCNHNKSIAWGTIIKSIEVYRMTEQLEKSWAGKVFNADELKYYANFLQELDSRFTESEREAFTQEWSDIVKQVGINLDKDPASDFGKDMGKRCMNWVNSFYGKKHVAIRNAIWEKGLKTNMIDHENALPPKSFAWLDQAISAYYRSRIMSILNQVETKPNDVLKKSWDELLTEMYGDDQPLKIKNEIFDIVMNDTKVSQAAKDWLKKVTRS